MSYRNTEQGSTPMWMLLVYFALALPSALWWAFATRQLWVWFVVPLGVTVVPSLWHMAGLTTLIGFLRTRPNGYDPRPWQEQFTAALGTAIVAPAIVLLFGAIYRALAF